MKLFVYSVLDSKLSSFDRPFYSMTDPAAVRAFMDAVADPQSPPPASNWGKHPEDYSLFRIGEFDDESGELTPCIPKSLITASSAVAKSAPN